MRSQFVKRQLAVLAVAAAGLSPALSQAQSVLIWSTQASPAKEQQAVRDDVLKGAPGAVEFLSNQEGPFLTRLNAEIQAGKGSIGVVGALHGQLTSNAGDYVDISKAAGTSKLSPAFMKLGRLGTAEQKYLPWMQVLEHIV